MQKLIKIANPLNLERPTLQQEAVIQYLRENHQGVLQQEICRDLNLSNSVISRLLKKSVIRQELVSLSSQPVMMKMLGSPSVLSSAAKRFK